MQTGFQMEQQAILASLQPAGHSRAIEPRSHARMTPRTHGPSAIPTGQSHSRAVSRSSTSSTSAHRRGSTLEREGIRASSRTARGTGKGRTGSDKDRHTVGWTGGSRGGGGGDVPLRHNSGSAGHRSPRVGSGGGGGGGGGRRVGLLADAEPLGEGWWRVSPRAAGKLQQCGLHRVIESNGAHRFLCAWEPRASDVIEVLRSPSPTYNLEVHAKCMSSAGGGGPTPQQRFFVAFALKSEHDFYCISADVGRREWALERIEGGTSTCIQAIGDASLRANVFYALLLQVRGSNVSLDANGVAVFTSVRLEELSSFTTDTSKLTGLAGPLGMLAHSSKSAFKGWKVYCPLGVPAPVSANRQVNGASGGAVKTGPGSTSGFRKDSQPGGRRESQPASGYLLPPKALPPPPAQAARAGGGSGDGGGGGGGGGEQVTQHQKIASFFNEDVALPRRYTGGAGGDEPQIVSQVEDDIIDRNLGTSFDDIAALSDAKRLLNEAIALPIMVPEFFTGIREPWKGVLLFGPPGTGKTMLAKAASAVNGSTFFNVSASLLVSKFRGESEKIVRCLFNMARFYSPSIVFIDEIDAIASSRGANEHEASRRLKTEIFTQMDGVASGGPAVDGSGGQVMVLATTNCPWDLDDAIRRRLEKRVFVPLPDLASRNDIFAINLAGMRLASDVRVLDLADRTEGYSGADVNLVCREASMMPMRRLIMDKSPEEIQAMHSEGLLQAPTVRMSDFAEAIQNTRPSVSQTDLGQFEAWDAAFGSR